MTTIKGMQNSQLHIVSQQTAILCRHNIWAAQPFPSKNDFIFQRWSHLCCSLFHPSVPEPVINE